MAEVSSTEKEKRNPAPAILFLAGPPGSGKTTLGSRVCVDLGRRFLDLADTLRDVGEAQESQSVLKQVIDQRAAEVYDDLDALGRLVLAYEDPKGKDVLDHLWPHIYEYARKVSDSPRVVARYNRTVEDFRRFLRETVWALSEE